jgi:hypothetical protein
MNDQQAYGCNSEAYDKAAGGGTYKQSDHLHPFVLSNGRPGRDPASGRLALSAQQTLANQHEASSNTKLRNETVEAHRDAVGSGARVAEVGMRPRSRVDLPTTFEYDSRRRLGHQIRSFSIASTLWKPTERCSATKPRPPSGGGAANGGRRGFPASPRSVPDLVGRQSGLWRPADRRASFRDRPTGAPVPPPVALFPWNAAGERNLRKPHRRFVVERESRR